jgi:hypothetical protein
MTADKAIARATTTMSALHIVVDEPVPPEVARRAQQAVAAIVATYLDDPAATEDQIRLEQMRPRTEAEAHAVVVMALRYAVIRQQLAEAAQVDDDLMERYRAGYRLLLDLDRCEHGRHSIDRCLMCPGGQSTGNLCLPAFSRPIGHTVHGVPIVMPDDPMQRSDPRNWMTPPAARDD